MTRISFLVPAGAALSLMFAIPPCVAADQKAARPGTNAEKTAARHIARGRYMLVVGSCNDCHTAGFAPNDGNVPEKDWLLGDNVVGFRGPWGTTYAPNLRLSLSKMTEAEWVKYAKVVKTRPPMPWFNLNQWTEADLRAFYQYVRQLGPVGDPVRDPVPPGQEPPRPYIQWPDKAPPKK